MTLYTPDRPCRVLNLGAGVQSTALAIMAEHNAECLAEGKEIEFPVLGQVDIAICGDTGDEPMRVYQHLVWLAHRCTRVRIILRSIHPQRNRMLIKIFPLDAPPHPRAEKYLRWMRRCLRGSLRGSLREGVNSTGQRFASIPAFTWDGKTLRMTRAGHVPDEGVVRRQCTREWKIDCVEKTIRRELFGLQPGGRMPADSVVQIFGLSYDESRRVIRVKQNFAGCKWARPEFPLFIMQQTRGGCRTWLRLHGPPYTVGRSACTHCPLHENEEWAEMADEDVPSWEEACQVDEWLRTPGTVVNRGMEGQLYLHRSCKPLREAPIRETSPTKIQAVFGFAAECEGMCGV
jgi:hypothetical protein